MLNILLTLFLFIFGATAVITLASLPGWITIPEKYRSRLFTSLLLEVIAAVILLFGNQFINVKENNFEIRPENWVGLNPYNMELLQPTYQLGAQEQKLGMNLEAAKKLLSSIKLYGELNGDGLSIQSEKGIKVGKIFKDNFPFYNSINIDGQQVSSTKNLKRVRFTRDGNKWRRNGKFLKSSNFYVEIEDVKNKGTIYKIKVDRSLSDRVMFSSEDTHNSNEILSAGNRLFHYFPSENSHFLFFIESADLNNEDPSKHYITFIQMKLELVLND